jgi:hypothetical protein
MATEASAPAPATTTEAPVTPAPLVETPDKFSSTWKLPDGIEDHIESGKGDPAGSV